MKCLTQDKVKKIAAKSNRQMIAETSEWSLVTATWVLFEKFKWSEDRVRYFLRRYDEQADMIAPLSERYIDYDERSKPGYTFDEIHEEVGLNIKLKNTRVAGNKVEQTVGFLQDHCIRWILDVMLNTLRNKCGWGDSMCLRFASYYNTAIPELDNPQAYCEKLKAEMKEKHGFILEVTIK